MDNGLFTLDNIKTLGGCSLAVYLMVQYSKTIIDRIFHIPTDILSVIYSFVILILTQIISGSATWYDYTMYFLAVPNSFIVAMTAAQIQQKASSAIGAKQQPPATNQ